MGRAFRTSPSCAAHSFTSFGTAPQIPLPPKNYIFVTSFCFSKTPENSSQNAKNTIAYSILQKHNTSGDAAKLKIKFDKITSHDITYVGIIQTARASGLEKFPIPYVLTNCHNSLCAVGGTINEDDHMFGLTCAQKYGGIYVPPHQAVITSLRARCLQSAAT